LVLNRFMYSRKLIALLLILLYCFTAYATATFTPSELLYSTIAYIVVLGYFTYYLSVRRSPREVIALTTFIVLVLIAGTVTGCIVIGMSRIGSLLYTLTISISSFTVLLSIGKLYKA